MINQLRLFRCGKEGCDMVMHMKQIAEATGETIYQQFYGRTSRNERNFKAVFGRHDHFVSSGPELLQVCWPVMENEADVILDFLKKLLKSDPKKRLTAQEAMEHEFFIDC